jgi:hypothetical protein
MEPFKYGSAFEAIKDLDRELERTEQLLDAKIQAVSDLLHDALKRIEEYTSAQKKTRKKA